jgi:fatty acid elongase 3
MSVRSFSTYDLVVIGPISSSPWAYFNKLWTLGMGYPATEFEFHSGETPLSTLKETAAIIIIYLVVVFGGREFMRTRKPLQLNGLFIAHNFILTVVSGALLVLFAEQLLPTLWKYGLYENICGGSGWTRPLVVLYYVSLNERGLQGSN